MHPSEYCSSQNGCYHVTTSSGFNKAFRRPRRAFSLWNSEEQYLTLAQKSVTLQPQITQEENNVSDQG